MTSQYSKMSKHVSLWWEIIRTLCRHCFVRQNQVPILVGLQCLAIHGVQWQFGRRCVCMLKRTYHRTDRKVRKRWLGRSWIPMLMNLGIWKTVKGKTQQRWCLVEVVFSSRGITWRKHPQGLAGFFGHIWIANALFFFVFFFLEGWFRKRLWQSLSKQHGEACVSFGMFSN